MFVEEKIWFDVTKVLKKRRKKGKRGEGKKKKVG